MSGRFPPLRFARNHVGAGSPTISANNLQSQKPARPGYYGQSIGHDIIENAARCELKHKISTKVTGLDLVIKSLYIRNIRAPTAIGFLTIIQGLNEVWGLENSVSASRTICDRHLSNGLITADTGR